MNLLSWTSSLISSVQCTTIWQENVMEVFGDDLSYNPLNVWNQAASPQHNFVTVIDPHTNIGKNWDTDIYWYTYTYTDTRRLLLHFSSYWAKVKASEQHESFAINSENSFPSLSFHNASFLLISADYNLFVNGTFSALYTRTLEGILTHCFCPKCAHSLRPS